MDINADNICKVPIDLIIKMQGSTPFDLYLKLSEKKIVKISHEQEYTQETFLKIKNKGIDFVYARKEDYEGFLENLREQLKKSLDDDKLSQEEKYKLLDRSQDVLKEALVKLGINKKTVKMASEVAINSFNFVKRHKNIFALVRDFKNKMNEEYSRALLISFVATAMVDTFDWSSAELKNKIFLASLFCDITLNEEEFAILHKHKYEPDKLPEKIFYHPIEISTMLKKSPVEIPSEVIKIVEQHHEQPDRSGFPRKIDYKPITLLSAIYIVAGHFIDLEFQTNFADVRRVRNIEEIKKRYYLHSYRKAMVSLLSVLRMQELI